MAEKRVTGEERPGTVLMEGDSDALRAMVERVAHGVMTEEAEPIAGAGRYKRRAGRTGWRHGTRRREWDTRVGTVELEVPRLRGEARYSSSFLQ